MPIQFDAVTKRIILDTDNVTATEVYSRWCDWAVLSDNLKYGMVIRQVGSDDLGGGLSIPPYYFLQGSWRIRPMESNHDLVIDGNLFVEGGGIPVVRTLGPYQVNVKYVVPVQAQGISTTGAEVPTAEEIASAVWNKLLASHQIPGSAGKALSTASSGGVDTEALAGAVWDRSPDLAVAGSMGELVKSIKVDTQKLLDATLGNWEIKNNQMIFYTQTGSVLSVFNLFDGTHQPSMTEVLSREKV